ncbi:MAG: hypothetical protein ACPIOQ_41070 [Promethearchaeia archaeon]
MLGSLVRWSRRLPVGRCCSAASRDDGQVALPQAAVVLTVTVIYAKGGLAHGKGLRGTQDRSELPGARCKCSMRMRDRN